MTDKPLIPINAVFETERLYIRMAGEADTDLFFALWTDGRVMGQVGFPRGLKITREKLRQGLAGQKNLSPYENNLVVCLKSNGEAIGEAWMGNPDANGISETDIKLLPEFWGQHYGVEVKRGLVEYLFTHSECCIIQATPNVGNTASIKMQEAVGGIKVGEETSLVPPGREGEMQAVHHYIYHVRREDWEKKRRGG
jgi:RimJ/RimL family protein N-acetyltransferase